MLHEEMLAYLHGAQPHGLAALLERIMEERVDRMDQFLDGDLIRDQVHRIYAWAIGQAWA